MYLKRFNYKKEVFLLVEKQFDVIGKRFDIKNIGIKENTHTQKVAISFQFISVQLFFSYSLDVG